MLNLSPLPKTWLIDLDGTIFPHNGYLKGIIEKPLRGVKDFFESLSTNDFIIILTSRSSIYRNITERNLHLSGIHWNLLLMDMPKGERILINDTKPSGLITAYAVQVERDRGLSGIRI